VVEGVAEITVEMADDRTVKINLEKSSGTLIEKSFELPVMIYKGVYVEGTEYKKGDTATWAGSLYTAIKATKEKPGFLSPNIALHYFF